MAAELPLVRKMGAEGMMWLLWTLLALTAVCGAYAAWAVLAFSRGNRASREEIEAGFAAHPEICDEAREGFRFVLAHETQPLFVESYDGKRLHAQLLRRENARGTILLFHGYRSNWAWDFALSVPFYLAQGFNLLLVDQRAHQDSEGRFLTFGVRERYDVLSWVTYLAQLLGSEHPMYLGGISMGAATVLMASCFDFPANVRGIIADCGYTSPREEMRYVIRRASRFLPARLILFWVGIFTRLLAGYGPGAADARASVAHSRVPILFIHGTDDRFVPCEMSKENYAACTAEKRLVLVEGARHGYSYVVDRPRVQSALETFLNDHLPKEDVL